MNTGIPETRPAKPLDPKRYPVIKHFRVQYKVTTSGVYAVDRLYADIAKMHSDLERAEAEVARLRKMEEEEI